MIYPPFKRTALTVALLTAAVSATANTTSPASTEPAASIATGNTPAAEAGTTSSPATAAINTVTVTGHYINAVGTSDAASQGTATGYLLKDIPLLRPGEVLENVPGMVVTQHSGDGKANQYFLRGYNLDHGTDFASFVDGVPVNMPTNAHGQGYSDLNFLIPEIVQQIDYQKGPYYANTGDFSSAGSGRIQYRDQLDQNILNLTTGMYDYHRAVIAGSTHLTADPDGLRVLGALEGLETNGPWNVPERVRKINGLFKLSDGDSLNGWSIDGIAYASHWDATDQVPLALIESGQLCRYCAISPSDGGNTGRYILSGEWHEHDDTGYTKASAYAEHYLLQLWSDFTFNEYRPATGDQFEQFENRNIVGGQLVRGWNMDFWGLPSVTEIGGQVRHDDIGVGLLDTVDRVPFATVNDVGVSETESAVYLQNTTHWTNWFRSIAGVRGDFIQINMNSMSTPINSGNISDSKASPKLSLIFGPWYKTEFFINYGKGFHSNDARGVLDKVDPTTGEAASSVPAIVGSVGKEIGLRTDLIPGLQTSLALWSLNSDSELTYDADSDIGSTDANGASRRYGLEWNNHWLVNHWLLLDGDVAWTHARYADSNANGDTGNLIPNAVSKVALFRATLRNLGPWTASWETRYISGYPLTQDGSLKAPSAVVSNLQVKRVITPYLTLSIEGLNLFNRQYYDIAYEQDYRVTPTSPIVPEGITVHPGEPRQLRVGLNFTF